MKRYFEIVAVYGTLRQGERNFQKYMAGAEYLGTTTTESADFIMFPCFGGDVIDNTRYSYPGIIDVKDVFKTAAANSNVPPAVEFAAGRVELEVYRGSQELIRTLDWLEEVKKVKHLDGTEKTVANLIDPNASGDYVRTRTRLSNGSVAWAYIKAVNDRIETAQVPHIETFTDTRGARVYRWRERPSDPALAIAA